MSARSFAKEPRAHLEAHKGTTTGGAVPERKLTLKRLVSSASTAGYLSLDASTCTGSVVFTSRNESSTRMISRTALP